MQGIERSLNGGLKGTESYTQGSSRTTSLACFRDHILVQSLSGLPTLPDSAEDFLIFRDNKPILVHKFDNLPDSGNFLSIKLYVI